MDNKLVMENTINWQRVREEFEKEMRIKLEKLPGHREVGENQKDLRSIISHEIPETAPIKLFENLTKILLSGEKIDIDNIRENFLKPETEKEEKIFRKYGSDFEVLRKSAEIWAKENLQEEQLQREWKEHKTWLPRRYTIYKESNIPFQKIASDTLARFGLIGRINHSILNK